MAPLYDSCTVLGWSITVESECDFPMVVGPDRWIGTSDNPPAWQALASDCGLEADWGPETLAGIAERLPDAISDALSTLPADVAARKEVASAAYRCSRRGAWLQQTMARQTT